MADLCQVGDENCQLPPLICLNDFELAASSPVLSISDGKSSMLVGCDYNDELKYR